MLLARPKKFIEATLTVAKDATDLAAATPGYALEETQEDVSKVFSDAKSDLVDMAKLDKMLGRITNEYMA